MEYNKEKVDDMMLALLWLTIFDEGPGTRAWKGYIDNPRSKNKSVILTVEGKQRAEELFNKNFGKWMGMIDSYPLHTLNSC